MTLASGECGIHVLLKRFWHRLRENCRQRIVLNFEILASYAKDNDGGQEKTKRISVVAPFHVSETLKLVFIRDCNLTVKSLTAVNGLVK